MMRLIVYRSCYTIRVVLVGKLSVGIYMFEKLSHILFLRPYSFFPCQRLLFIVFAGKTGGRFIFLRVTGAPESNRCYQYFNVALFLI
jgi:hypothetical protein